MENQLNVYLGTSPVEETSLCFSDYLDIKTSKSSSCVRWSTFARINAEDTRHAV